jgi:H+/Cl- antiporter ClcA
MVVGSYLYFGFPKLKAFQAGDILFYVIIAIFATASTLLFSETLKKIVLYRASLKSSRGRFWMALLSSLFFSLLVVFVSSNGLGLGKYFLEKMLFENYSASIQDLLSRFAGTLFTYSSGGAGGIFAPILSIGGSAASFFDELLNLELGSLAVVIGMTAALASLTHSPLTSFILILEMTDRHTAIFPLMLAAAVGHGLSKYLQKNSFYEFVAGRILTGIVGENKAPHQQSDK